MKQLKQRALAILLMGAATTTFGQVGIGTDTPDATAVLELQSTEKGFLLPRMTETERDAITSPAAGLWIYNLTEHCLNYWNATE